MRVGIIAVIAAAVVAVNGVPLPDNTNEVCTILMRSEMKDFGITYHTTNHNIHMTLTSFEQ
jgi:hypothetical protein